MRLLLNLLWIVFGGGFAIALQYLLGGLILCLTVIGIPFGVQCLKLARLSLMPFGKEVVDDPAGAGTGVLGFAMNILWLVFGGLTTFISHLILAFTLTISIIGIPFALQHVKLGILALFPFGRRVIENRA